MFQRGNALDLLMQINHLLLELPALYGFTFNRNRSPCELLQHVTNHDPNAI
ncbi:MAG: hypothetical protein H0X37_22965 [Herpetosiphonaceae bacterium]|nr:hypothetical protein [Herpetosiphonaceae bacterium]